METATGYRKKLIVSADDFGLNRSANKNILAMSRLGKIDRVAVLTGGFVSREDLDEMKKNGTRIDLHLTLPEGIRKRRGVVCRSFLFLTKYALRKSSVLVLEKEWETQINKFREIFGQSPAGLNSHEYVHFFPPYFRLALKLCEKYAIDYLRFGKAGVLKNGKPVSKILHLLHGQNLNFFSAYKLNTSDHIASLDWIKKPGEFLKNLPAGTTELICHPERNKELEIMTKYF